MIPLWAPTVSGSSVSGYHASILRLLPDGQPDPALGVNGMLDVTPRFGDATTLSERAGGGWWQSDQFSGGNVRVTPLTADFQPTGSFVAPGATMSDSQPGSWNPPTVLESLSGKVVLVDGGDTFEARAFTATGAVDVTFGALGVFSLAPGFPLDLPFGVLGTSDGGALLGGMSGSYGALARIDASGLDVIGFGTGGHAAYDAAGRSLPLIEVIAPAPGGGWIVAGEADAKLMLGRIHADGSVDTTFGDSGWVVPANCGGRAHALVVEANGRIVVANESVWAFTQDGDPDVGFGSGGVAPMPPIPFDFNRLHADYLAVQSDGRILVGGVLWKEQSWPDTGNFGFICRISANGHGDPSFASGGYFFYQHDEFDTGVRDLCLDRQDRATFWDRSDGSIFRLSADGELDPGFGGTGSVMPPLSPTRITVNDDASVLIASFAQPGVAILTRLDPSGSVDPGCDRVTLPAPIAELTAVTLAADRLSLYVAGHQRGDMILQRALIAPALAQTAAPLFSVPGGVYAAPPTVALSCSTVGAEIRYTTDGSMPSATSTLYTAPILVGTAVTMRAFAAAPGCLASGVVRAAYALADHPPTDLQLGNAFVPEGRPPGVVIGSLTATDLDANDTFSYGLVSGSGATDNAAFAVLDHALVTAATFDAAVKSSYSVRIRGTDAYGLWCERAFAITVVAVNHAPTFVPGADPTVLEDCGPCTLPGWAGTISAGPGDAGQSMSFEVTNDAHGLFAAQPAISPAGDLTFTPNAQVSGGALVTVRLVDDGGRVNGGIDTSAVISFPITILPVNDAPSFTPGPDLVVMEDAGAQTLPGWASAMSAGPADESGQALDFQVTSDHPALFAAQPAIAPDGTLTFTTAPNANTGISGSCTVTVRLHDSGGTAHGGVDRSTPVTVAITVMPVNDAPTAVNASLTTFRDTSVSGTLIASDIDGDAVTYAVVTPPVHGTVSVFGLVATYSPNPGFIGSDAFTYQVDDGSVLSNVATVAITVAASDPGGSTSPSVTVATDGHSCGLGGGGAGVFLLGALGLGRRRWSRRS